MEKKPDLKQTVTYEELTMSNMYEIQALFNLLDRKGIVSKTEILQEIKIIFTLIIKIMH